MTNIEDPIIQVKQLRVQFPNVDFPAFENLCFEVPRGSIYGVFGETGCGKSTLSQCLIGFISPEHYQGEILFRFRESEPIAGHTLEEKEWRNRIRGKKIVYVPQDPYKSLNPYEKIKTQLARILKCHGKPYSVEKMLEQVGLSSDLAYSYPQMMSAGQRQRVMVACALAVEPELLILDEPTASVDAVGRKKLRSCFQELVEKENATIIVISHEVDEYTPIIPKAKRLYFSKVTSTAIQVQQGRNRNSISSSEEPVFFKIEKITKKYDNLPVLKDLSLEVPLNHWIYLEGSNGTGKTTLLRIIMGLLKPNSGKFEWQGKNIHWERVRSITKFFIHPVFQDAFHSINPRLPVIGSIEEVIHCLPSSRQKEMIERLDHLWALLGLTKELFDRLPHQLSYGQQKRVALVRTLLKYELEKQRYPQAVHLFLFDEVFAGIHWSLRDKIIFLLKKMGKEQKFSIIWVAHGHDVLKALCQINYRLTDGKLHKE